MESHSRDIYEALENDTGTIIKEINKLLSSGASKIKGLKLMNSFLCICCKEDFIENCINWMQWCCKNDNSDDIIHLSLEVLTQLILESSKYGELNKSVAHFLSTRFFGKYFKKYIQMEPGWKCTEMCFMYYKGPCGIHKETIKQYLLAEINKGVVSSTIAHIYSLIPGVGESGSNGINYKNNWRSQFDKVLNICHSILHDFFTNIVELQTYDHLPYEEYRGTEFVNEEQLCTLFYNYGSILQCMLLCKFSVTKSIIPEKVFDVVCRCLNVTFKTLESHSNLQTKKVMEYLPQFHIVAYSLLQSLIITCKTHLLPYSQLIIKLIKQTLQSTSASVLGAQKNFYVDLRTVAYDTLRNWLIVAKGGACAESMSTIFMSFVIEDIMSQNTFVHIKDTKSSNNIPSMNTEMSKIHSSNEKLCYSALKALELYLMEFGCKLKAEQHKVLQLRLLKQITDVQRSYSTQDFMSPYSSSKCRYGLYQILMATITNTCPSWPSPVHWALRLYTKGVDDCNADISSYCSMALSNLLTIIHPEYNLVSLCNITNGVMENSE